MTSSDQTKSTRLAKRVLLVGLSGVDWPSLLSSVQAGGLPALAALLRSGVTGPLSAPVPQIEPSLWTCLITGQRAYKHGVLHRQQPHKGNRGTIPVSRPTIETATLGAILSESRLTVNQIGWPVTHPVEHLRGVAVSDRFASESRADSSASSAGWPWIAPPSAAQELFARRCTPADVEEVALAQLVPADLVLQPVLARLERICRAVMAESLTLFRAAKWCMQQSKWDCTVCAFPAIQRLRQALGSTLSQHELQNLGGNILAGCYEHLDMILGQLIATAGEDATIVLVGMDSSSMMQPRLVMSGPQVSAGVSLPQSASVLDITPTILTLLGVPVAKDMDGQAWTNMIFKGEQAGLHSPELVETWSKCIHVPTEQPVDSKTSESQVQPPLDESVQHLVELGYVDPLESQAEERADHCRRDTRRNRALSLLDDGLQAEAISELQSLKLEYPDWPATYELLAETYLQRGDIEAAEQELEFLVHHGAESARLYFVMGRIAASQRQLNEALAHYHVAERLSADLCGLQLARGLATLRRQDYESALEALRQALATERPTAQILDGLATCSLGLKKFEQAAEFALAAIEQDTSFAPAHYHLALALVALGRMTDAKQAFELGLVIDPEFLAPLRRLARLCETHFAAPEQAETYRRRGREIIRRRRQSRRANSA